MAGTERVYLGLGSNVDARRRLRAGVDALKARFGQLACSPVYQSTAVGFCGDDFLNACCRVETDLEPEALKAWLTELEDRHGRRRDLPKFADRTLDIDILLFGDRVGKFGKLELPRGEILKYAHVLKPLADLAPELKHPVTGKTFAEHWREFEGDRSLTEIGTIKL
ncbi:MAG: 2-amino-4-hydroxy-6-hydroxymethyldihydropteridine diphosphokinase [Wenzhouxiangellaceae bacterium]|nr:2-amino-4-hydroxy-6-hydroxymethyldihydropteridine diphosphokinase [Wenzhouxiangellaceae bacterium]